MSATIEFRRQTNISKSSGIATNLLAYWSMEEASGNLLDELGRCQAAPYSGNLPTYQQTGKINYSIDFPGTTTGARVNDTSAQTYLNPEGDVYSIQAWVNLNELPSVSGHVCTILRSSLAATPWENIVVRIDTDNRVTMRFTGTSDNNYIYATVSSISSGVWYHLVFVIAGIDNTPKIYVNGSVTNGSTTQVGDIYDVSGSTAGYNIGNAYNGTNIAFNGRIDELAVWRKALSSDEVIWLYNNGNGRSYSDF